MAKSNLAAQNLDKIGDNTETALNGLSSANLKRGLISDSSQTALGTPDLVLVSTSTQPQEKLSQTSKKEDDHVERKDKCSGRGCV